MTHSNPSHTQNRLVTLLTYYFSIWTVIGAIFLIPLITTFFYPQERNLSVPFFVVGGVMIVAGWILRQWLMPEKWADVSVPDGMMLIVMTWLTAILVSTIPLMWIADLSFPQAVFEATSGWTTCGLTVIDVTEASQIILFFRSLMQYVGGVGFVLVTMLAFFTPAEASVLVASGSDDHFNESTRKTITIVFAIYAGYTLLGILAYILVGMGTFDAINHTMTALSTGGFSTQSGSIGDFNSFSIEAVTVVLMLVGAVNFSTAWVLLKGNIRYFFENAEIRVSMVVLPAVTLLLILSTTIFVQDQFGTAAWLAVFESTSALTTTGFTITSYDNWRTGGVLLLIILMFVGGGSGSTAGGLKQSRVYALYLRLKYEINEIYLGKEDPELPNPIIPEPRVREGEDKHTVDEEVGSEVGAILFAFIGVFLTSVFLMTLLGYSLEESTFETASIIGTVGLSVGVTDPAMPLPMFYLMSAVMLLGRLELFAVLIGLVRAANYGFGGLSGNLRPDETPQQEQQAATSSQRQQTDHEQEEQASP